MINKLAGTMRRSTKAAIQQAGKLTIDFMASTGRQHSRSIVRLEG